MGDVEVNVASLGVVNVLSVDDNGRLVLALGTSGVGRVQSVPVQGTAGFGVVERVGGNSAISGTREERGAMEARRGRRSGESEDGSGNLHFDLSEEEIYG